MNYECILCKDSGSFGGKSGHEFICYCVSLNKGGHDQRNKVEGESNCNGKNVGKE
jgi:hypothetical protein